jgi:hypothetical protein
MPIIVGAPRSGTTLLRFMLDAHPELAIPPETDFLTIGDTLPGHGEQLLERFFIALTNFPSWPDFELSKDNFWTALHAIEPFTVRAGFRTFYRLYADRFGKSRWGDKTPIYSLNIDTIRKILPEAHFIHIIRDGRDVALSLRTMWFSPGDDMETLASYWRKFVTSARAAGAGHADYLEIRYEDLIQNTQKVLQGVCEYLCLDFDPAMLSYHTQTAGRLKEHKGRAGSKTVPTITHDERLQQQWRTTQPLDASRVFAWKTEMSDADHARFQRIAGDLLRELGYDSRASV